MQRQHPPQNPKEQQAQRIRIDDFNSLFEGLKEATKQKKEELLVEIDQSFQLQCSLIKYVFNNPEKIDEVIPSPECLFEDLFGVFNKIKSHVQFLKDERLDFDQKILLAELSDGEKDLFYFHIEAYEEPKNVFDAIGRFSKIKDIHNRIMIYRGVYSMLSNPIAAPIYAKQLARMANDLPVHANVFDTRTKLTRTKYSLKHGGVPILEDSNFYIFMGQEKSGKSHILSVFLAAYLFGKLESFRLESMIGTNERVLYIDTEQSASDALNICQTANLLAGRRYDAPNDRLLIASCDQVPADQMLLEISGLIEQHKPKVVFIDGYAGLIEDAYNVKGADPTMREIRTLARRYNMVVIGVFHSKTEYNPLTPDKDPIQTAFGAFGKVCMKYGGGSFAVTNKSGLVSIKNIQSRKSICPTIYCKFNGVIYIDMPGRDVPDICPVIDGNTDEVLQPRHLDVNDESVHLFYVPECISEGEYQEAEDAADIQEEQKKEVRAIQKRQAENEANFFKIQADFLAIFGDDDILHEAELAKRWVALKNRQSGFEENSEAPKKWKMERSRQKTAAQDLGIIDSLPEKKFRIIRGAEPPKK